MTDHGNMFGAVHFVNAQQPGLETHHRLQLYVLGKKDDHNTKRTPPDCDTYNQPNHPRRNDEGCRGGRLRL